MADTPNKDAAAKRQAEYQRRYFQQNREKILARRQQKKAEDRATGEPRKPWSATQTPESLEKHRQKCREYYAANREQRKARAQKWREENRERMLATQREYRQSHYEEQKARFNSDEEARRKRYAYLSAWQKKKTEQDPSFAEYRRIMARMHRAMRKHLAGRRVTAASRIVQLLGCDWLHFVAHIEAQFQPGMTWQNHGQSGWHFDHIVPLSAFDLTDEEQLRKGCHYTNVQPLWAADNIRKGGKVA
jgi:hypothetical protein